MAEKKMANKKEQIRQAAITIFAQLGYHEANTDKIAAEAEVAVGTIYNYFKNKEDILDYIFQVEYEKREDFFKELMLKDYHAAEKIKAILEMHFIRVSKNPDLIKIILEEMRFSRGCYPRHHKKKKGMQKFLEEIIEQGKAEEKIKDCNSEIVALVLFGSIEALMREYIYELEEKGHSNLLSDAVNELSVILWDGLAVQSKERDEG